MPLIRRLVFLVVLSVLCIHAYSIKDDYYLVDTLNFHQLTARERLFLREELPNIHKIESDTLKIRAVHKLYERFNDNDVWVEYLYWIKNQVDLLPNKGSYVDFKNEYYWVYYNDLGYYVKYKGFRKASIDTLNKALNYVQPNTLKHTYTLINLSTAYNRIGDMEKAIEYQWKGFEVYKRRGDTLEMATVYNDVAQMYNDRGILDKAIQLHYEGLKLRQAIGDSTGIATSLNNLGSAFNNNQDYEQAEKYFIQGLEIFLALKDLRSARVLQNNLGLMYTYTGRYEKAVPLFNKSMNLSIQTNDSIGLSFAYHNLGVVLKRMGNMDSSITCFEQSLEIRKKLRYTDGYAISQNNLAQIYLLRKDYKTAIDYAEASLKISKELGYTSDIRNAALSLHEAYKNNERYEDALAMYELYVKMNDSIMSEKNQKAAIRQQTKYEFEKAQLVAEQQRKEELRIQNEKLERRDNLQYSVIFIGILGVFGLVMALGKISVSPKFAEGLIFFAFLLFFEFLLVLTDPFLEGLTGGAPVYKLIGNALLAAVIFPIHGFFEAKLKTRIIK